MAAKQARPKRVCKESRATHQTFVAAKGPAARMRKPFPEQRMCQKEGSCLSSGKVKLSKAQAFLHNPSLPWQCSFCAHYILLRKNQLLKDHLVSAGASCTASQGSRTGLNKFWAKSQAGIQAFHKTRGSIEAWFQDPKELGRFASDRSGPRRDPGTPGQIRNKLPDPNRSGMV